MTTELLFLNNTFLYAMLVKVIQADKDENGFFFVTDRTIFYPQGGGQPNDLGWVSKGRDDIKIVTAKYGTNGIIKHYTNYPLPQIWINSEVAMHIDSIQRKLNAAFHTAGHWLAQIVNENLQIDLIPVKGHHFAGEAYVEFDGNLDLISEDTLDKIKLAMRIDLQAGLEIKSEFATMESSLMRQALLPKNFKPLVDRPLRLVIIDDYKPVPCGGTHFDTLRGIKTVLPTKFYKKGKRVRLAYECTIWNEFSS